MVEIESVWTEQAYSTVTDHDGSRVELPTGKWGAFVQYRVDGVMVGCLVSEHDTEAEAEAASLEIKPGDMRDVSGFEEVWRVPADEW